ncbi:MAG TPA: hypothetical protein VNO50_21730 [Pyrinomonadaceae bacterium]|nr:hypothetical protein [Pyrinomonadaceae bacterium]
MKYSYAQLGGLDTGFFRIGGTGLANLLFPWAHFVVGTSRYGLKPLAPTWPQFKTGPLLRAETDKRFYADLFRVPPDQVSGLRKMLLLATLPRVSQADFDNAATTRESRLVEFDQKGPMFDWILNEHALVKQELLRITRDHHKAALQFDFRNSISVHVRLGDFQVESLQTPIEWFAGAIREVRRTVGSDIRVHIFSDGTDDELRPLLDLARVSRIGFGSSIADLLGLSCAKVLIANGGSSFSKWASYIGRMPVIWRTGTLYQKLYSENAGSEIEWQPGEGFTEAFTQCLISATKSSKPGVANPTAAPAYQPS